MKTILVDAVDCFVSNEGVIYKEMYDLLETFPNKKILLTGASDEQFKKFGLDKMPYEVFTLKHDPEKTAPKYFEVMLEHFDLPKEDVIYFEHNPKAVESAQRVGIKTYYFDPEKKDLLKLKVFIEQNLSDIDNFLVHSCEQVLRFTQVSKWDDLTEERKVQLGFNMGAMAHGLGLTKEEGFLALSNAREGITSMEEFRRHLKSLVTSHGVKVDEVNIAKPF